MSNDNPFKQRVAERVAEWAGIEVEQAMVMIEIPPVAAVGVAYAVTVPRLKQFKRKLEEGKINQTASEPAASEPSTQALTADHIQQHYEQDASVILD